jgi:SAM-dependent methyltransferase
VLDVGCGQGTQAVALARLGHRVVGLDLSDELLAVARTAAASEPGDVARRLTFVSGDLLALGTEHTEAYDVVCCHGVAMYLPSLERVVQALAAAVRPGGLISLLTKNSANLVLRATMNREWESAAAAFDGHRYTNRLGIDDARADEPDDVHRALAAAGATTDAWYGVRLFTDHWANQPPGDDFSAIVDVEEEAGRRDPYRALAALTHTIARRA